MHTFRALVGLAAAAGVALAATGVVADSHQVRVKGITLSERVVRASIGHVPNSAAYLIISNANGAPDRLMSAACACAARVEVHASHPMAGMPSMMEMGPAGPVVIPAHGSVAFRPGGMHLMLTGLKERLMDGGEQKITLVFEHAGAITADFHVSARVAVNGSPRTPQG